MEKSLAMQATISRQNHAQNLLSTVIFMLIICYYAFNGIPQDAFEKKQFLMENAEYNKTVEFERNVSQLRAAVLMDADAVQINGLLFSVENTLGEFIDKKKAKFAVQNIYDNLLSNERKKAIRLINQLPTLFLSQK